MPSEEVVERSSTVKIKGGYRHDNKEPIAHCFKSFRLDPFTVDWNDEIGFAPERLYELGVAA